MRAGMNALRKEMAVRQTVVVIEDDLVPMKLATFLLSDAGHMILFPADFPSMRIGLCKARWGQQPCGFHLVEMVASAGRTLPAIACLAGPYMGLPL